MIINYYKASGTQNQTNSTKNETLKKLQNQTKQQEERKILNNFLASKAKQYVYDFIMKELQKKISQDKIIDCKRYTEIESDFNNCIFSVETDNKYNNIVVADLSDKRINLNFPYILEKVKILNLIRFNTNEASANDGALFKKFFSNKITQSYFTSNSKAYKEASKSLQISEELTFSDKEIDLFLPSELRKIQDNK